MAQFASSTRGATGDDSYFMNGHARSRASMLRGHRVPLVTFSHVRWNDVFQRPQHIMTRIGTRRPVLFVEEPIVREGPPTLEVEVVAPGVRVARPVLEVGGSAFGDSQHVVLEAMLRKRLDAEGWNEFAAWLYTPMAIRLAKALHPLAILYDSMDQWTEVRHAPPESAERERELLAAADAVMAGGPSLHREKSNHHSFVRCFPSSVDVAHFRVPQSWPEPFDQAGLPQPRLGYCGAIDERVDLAIIAGIAFSRPRLADRDDRTGGQHRA